MKINRLLKRAGYATSGLLLFALAVPGQAAPVITNVNADLAAAPFTFSFLGSSFTFTGTGGFPDYLSVTTSGNAAVRTVLGSPSTDFPDRNAIVYDQDTLGGYGAFPTATAIHPSNGENFLGLRVTSGAQNYYGFLYSTDTKLNSYGFEQSPNVGITPTTAQAVPEPATWAMFIGGFGLVGSAMRRRQKITSRVGYAA